MFFLWKKKMIDLTDIEWYKFYHVSVQSITFLFTKTSHVESRKKLSLFPKYQNSITFFSSIYHFFPQKHPMSNPEKKKDPMSCLKEVTSSVPREFTGGEFMVMTPTPGDWFSGDFHGNVMGFVQDFMGDVMRIYSDFMGISCWWMGI